MDYQLPAIIKAAGGYGLSAEARKHQTIKKTLPEHNKPNLYNQLHPKETLMLAWAQAHRRGFSFEDKSKSPKIRQESTTTQITKLKPMAFLFKLHKGFIQAPSMETIRPITTQIFLFFPGKNQRQKNFPLRKINSVFCFLQCSHFRHFLKAQTFL